MRRMRQLKNRDENLSSTSRAATPASAPLGAWPLHEFQALISEDHLYKQPKGVKRKPGRDTACRGVAERSGCFRERHLTQSRGEPRTKNEEQRTQPPFSISPSPSAPSAPPCELLPSQFEARDMCVRVSVRVRKMPRRSRTRSPTPTRKSHPLPRTRAGIIHRTRRRTRPPILHSILSYNF